MFVVKKVNLLFLITLSYCFNSYAGTRLYYAPTDANVPEGLVSVNGVAVTNNEEQKVGYEGSDTQTYYFHMNIQGIDYYDHNKNYTSGIYNNINTYTDPGRFNQFDELEYVGGHPGSKGQFYVANQPANSFNSVVNNWFNIYAQPRTNGVDIPAAMPTNLQIVNKCSNTVYYSFVDGKKYGIAASGTTTVITYKYPPSVVSNIYDLYLYDSQKKIFIFY